VQAVVIPTIPGGEPFSLEYQHFVGRVLENRLVRADGVDRLRTAQVLEARRESLKNRGMPVDPGKF